MSAADYSKLKVKELRQLLKAKGLVTSGVKAVLVQRLDDAQPTVQKRPAANIDALPVAPFQVRPQLEPETPREQQPTTSTSKAPARRVPLEGRSSPAAAQPPAKKARVDPPISLSARPAISPTTAPLAPPNLVHPPKRAAFKSPFLGAGSPQPVPTSPQLLPSSFGKTQLFSQPPRLPVSAAFAYLESTWLARLFSQLNPSTPFDLIAPDLFSSPDFPNQFNMSIRFLSNWFYVALMSPRPSRIENDELGSLDAIRSLPIVVECEPVIEEIFKIVTMIRGDDLQGKGKAISGRRTTHFCLAATGEVLGTTLAAALRTQSIGVPNFSVRSKTMSIYARLTRLDSGLELRADWAAYVDEARAKLNQGDAGGLGFVEKIRTSEEDDFRWGMSRSLREGRGKGGARLSEEERTVATSYLFSHLSPTCISGPTPASLVALAHLHDSLPSPNSGNAVKLALYLPPLHHLESVFLPPDMPDVAVVQAAQGTRYILRETGQEVGSENEGGLFEAWKLVLERRT